MIMGPIIILGMHRSGTTMLSKILEDLGVFMGWRKEENNESLFFLKFNDWVLQQANATWDNPYNYAFADDNFKNLMCEFARIYIKGPRRIEYLGPLNFLRYRSLNEIDFPWGWKDPRNTFTIDIWLRIFPAAKIIHIYRNRVDVAESLRKRAEKYSKKFRLNLKKKIAFVLTGGYFMIRSIKVSYNVGFADSLRVMNLREGFELWKAYVERAFEIEKKFNLKVLHLRYEDFIEEPREYISRILDFIGIEANESKIKSALRSVRQDRKYAFTKSKELVEFYKTIENEDIVKKLGYSNLI